MDVQPHPELSNWSVVTIEDADEHLMLIASATRGGLLRNQGLEDRFLASYGETDYPHEISTTRSHAQQMGRRLVRFSEHEESEERKARLEAIGTKLATLSK